MAGRHYFLITSLPPLGDLGSAPPLTAAQLLERVGAAGPARALVEALFLGDDLLQREALLAGQIDQAEPAVLHLAQLRDEEPLPACLIREDADPAALRVPADAVWSAYYYHAADVAERQASGFLAEWVRHEVGLRNALAAARAKALGLEVEGYLVASDLGQDADDLTGVVSEWAAAPNPLAGLRTLDNARWTWLAEHDRYFSFGDDELAAYAAKLMLLHRWHRLAEAAAGADDGQDRDAEGPGSAAAQPGQRTQP